MKCESLHGQCGIVADNSKCCWCSDVRKPSQINMRYIDGYGELDVRFLNLTYPKDIFYCSSCKKSPHSTATFDSTVSKHISMYKKSHIGSSKILSRVNEFVQLLRYHYDNKRSLTVSFVVEALSLWINQNWFKFHVSHWLNRMIKATHETEQNNKTVSRQMLFDLIYWISRFDASYVF